jgi:autotransporter translocation and assembly factor TamB
MMPAVAGPPAAGPLNPQEKVMKTLAAVLVAVALALVPVAAQDAKKIDITGTWEMTVESPQGQMVITANYKQEGEALTGTHVSEMGEAPLKGTVKGADIEYTLTLDMGGQQMSILHKAKVDGDTITGSAIIGEMGTIAFTAKRKK